MTTRIPILAVVAILSGCRRNPTEHCPNLEFQRQVLTMLDRLRIKKETRPQNFTFLFDHIALAESLPEGTTVANPDGLKKQRYGTQGKCEGFEWQPFALELPGKLDILRANVGLEPLNQYRESITCP